MTNRIAALRKERRLSQAELADALEVTRQTIISLESGRYNAGGRPHVKALDEAGDVLVAVDQEQEAQKACDPHQQQ